MTPFQYAKWIFADTEVCEDLYTEYIDTLPKGNVQTILYISADTDYTLRINCKYVASNQYGDFEHYKIYDELPIGEYLIENENLVEITLYYSGTDTQRYCRADAGLIYEVWQGEKCIGYSSEDTLSRKSPTYQSGLCRLVSRQLGYTFAYDSTAAHEGGYTPSRLVSKRAALFPRPIPKQTVGERVPMQSITKTDTGSYLVDLGREVVGLATLSFTSTKVQTLCIAYGESLTDAHVRKTIHDRHFFFEYTAKAGQNEFTEYMLRLGCRYLEVFCDSPIQIDYIGILPQIYEVEEIPHTPSNADEQRIYDASVNTLRLCMMEHYVDTPWREQCLYAFDSRNQMLSGYTAFQGGNREYARASLALMSEERRGDGLLSICAPCGTGFAIPSFSLYYVIAMQEYGSHTGDFTLAKKYSAKIEGILDEFLARKNEDGVILNFPGSAFWNFYDWSEHLDGADKKGGVPDLIINTLVILALDACRDLFEKAAIPFRYANEAEALRVRAREIFRTKTGLYSLYRGENNYTTLGNALAILSGVATPEQREGICDRIVRGELTPSSLSMSVWIYDALIKTSVEKYRAFIRTDILAKYGEMAKGGTVWETELGAADFDGAGSLCHGWSAVPVYIYEKLGLLA